MRGPFITFEGGDGSGKSTQVELLAEWLIAGGHEVTTAREPGTTPTGEAVRGLLLETASDELVPEAELVLYIAARAQLAAEIVRPALEEGRVVLLDRYGDSSVAYQGYGRGLDPGWIEECNFRATRGLVPDLTVLIDMPVEAAAERNRDRQPDRLERASEEFHQRVRAGYLELARKEPERFRVIEGRQPIDAIQEAIRDRVGDLLAAWNPQRTKGE